MPNVTSASAQHPQHPVLRQRQPATSAGDVTRTYAELATKKVLSVLHVPDKLTDTASVVSLQEANVRAQKLAMNVDKEVNGGLYKECSETTTGSLVPSTKVSDKNLEQSRIQEARQADGQGSARCITQAQVLAACQAYRVMQHADNQMHSPWKAERAAGAIISTVG